MSTNYTKTTPLSLLPPTTNPWLLQGGELTLYNPTLLLIANALFQHAAVSGLVFLLRGFSARRALDLHFLTIIFAVSFIAAPLIFLIDTHIDSVKLWFFLEHEAIEYLVAIRVLAPLRILQQYAGLLIFLCWTGLALVSMTVSLNAQHMHGADIIAWGAFTSDTLISISGAILIARWLQDREYGNHSDGEAGLAIKAHRRKVVAEAMAGLGFCFHGLSTLTVAPILHRVLYHGLDPAYFAYAWVMVFFFAFFTVALSVPVASIFFSTIHWAFWHDRKILPGEAKWSGEDLEIGADIGIERRRTTVRLHVDHQSRPRGKDGTYWTKLAEKYASPSYSNLDA